MPRLNDSIKPVPMRIKTQGRNHSRNQPNSRNSSVDPKLSSDLLFVFFRINMTLVIY